MSSKSHFCQWKTYFSQFIGKFEEMKYLIHYAWNKSNHILRKLPISFSTVKLKLRPNLSHFIHRFKYSYVYVLNMGFLSAVLMLHFSNFLQFTKTFWDIFICFFAFTSKFFLIFGKEGYTSKLLGINSLSLLDFIFIRSWE